MANITKEERERRARLAVQEGSASGDADKQPEAEPEESDEHVYMTRDAEQWPEPHRAHVHRSEIKNYYPGGWEVEHAD